MIFGETMNPVLKEKKFLVLAITVVVVVAGLALYLSSSSSAQSLRQGEGALRQCSRGQHRLGAGRAACLHREPGRA
jgi:hypothetical protein